MEQLTLSAAVPTDIVACHEPQVYVNGQRRRDLRATSWEILPAPELGKASLVLAADVDGNAPRIQEPGATSLVGARVRIVSASSQGGAEFRGAIASYGVKASQDGEHIVLEARHELCELLSATLSTLFQRQDEKTVELQCTRVRFSDSLCGLCSEQPVRLGRRWARLFDASGSARPWTVADALGYLLATAVPASVQVPDLDELESLGGQIDLGVLEVTALSAVEALARVAQRGGLAIRPANEGSGLIVFRPGADGPRRSIGLQTAGSRLSVAQSSLWTGAVTLSRRPCRLGVLALGQAKRYESTFDLVAGWDPGLQTGRWRDLVRSLSPNWAVLSDVYRKWVLNEHGWYARAPWNLPTYGFSELGGDWRLRLPRRLLPCLSTNTNRQSLGVVVEFRTDGQAPWRQWPGPLWVGRDECAVYFDGDALPGDFFQAAVEGSVEVRATATVQADTRLTVRISGDAGAGVAVIDVSARAAWRKVHQHSIFFGRQDLGPPSERDDSLLLDRLARSCRQTNSKAMEAHLELGMVDTSIRVGDIVEQIGGRVLELASNPQSRPHVASVRHEFGQTQTTRVIMRG